MALLASLAFIAPLAQVPTAGATSALALRSIEREGSCSGTRGDWELRARSRLGNRIRIEFRVDDLPARQRWDMYVADNGRRVASVSRVTRPSGGIKVTRITKNRRGRDRIRAAAVNTRSGNTCVGRLRF